MQRVVRVARPRAAWRWFDAMRREAIAKTSGLDAATRTFISDSESQESRTSPSPTPRECDSIGVVAAGSSVVCVSIGDPIPAGYRRRDCSAPSVPAACWAGRNIRPGHHIARRADIHTAHSADIRIDHSGDTHIRPGISLSAFWPCFFSGLSVASVAQTGEESPCDDPSRILVRRGADGL